MHEIDVDRVATEELQAAAGRMLGAWSEDALELLPPDDARVDAHCHLGRDIDGSTLEPEELLAQLDRAGMRHAACTPLAQADGYAAENERVREVAAASGGRLLALHRCDPRAANPAADAAAGLAAGAVGLKWHPRAERFGMHDAVAGRTAAVADEAGVPILIHAGRGMERLGEGVVELARRHERATFILAHCAVSDLAWIVDATRELPNVLFDTSWWRTTDIAVLLSSVDPGRVVHGSDPPYGTAGLGLVLTARIARACGWNDVELRALFGGSSRYLLGIDDVRPEFGARAVHHMPEEEPTFRRCAELLTSAMQCDFADGDPTEAYDLADLALHVHDAHPRAAEAAALHVALRVGRALLDRDRSRRDHEEAGGFMTWSPARRRGIELLCATLAHLSTPTLPIRIGEPPFGA